MPDHRRTRGFLFLSKRQELGGDTTTYIAIECYDARNEDTVDNSLVANLSRTKRGYIYIGTLRQ
jgi:hypothetical protein